MKPKTTRRTCSWFWLELIGSTCFSQAAVFGFLSLQRTKQQGQLSPNTLQEPSPPAWPCGTVLCLLIIVATKKPEARLSFNNVDAVIAQSKVINLIQLSYESWHGTNFATCYHEIQKKSYMHIYIYACNICNMEYNPTCIIYIDRNMCICRIYRQE